MVIKTYGQRLVHDIHRGIIYDSHTLEKNPNVYQQVNKLWYICTMKYLSKIKKEHTSNTCKTIVNPKTLCHLRKATYKKLHIAQIQLFGVSRN